MAINLVKGQKIDLRKKDTGTVLSQVCVGLNWGVIEKEVEVREGGFLGFGGTPVMKKKVIEVDLDASCLMLNSNKEILDVVYYGQLKSTVGGVTHSGDDLTGDLDGDDGLDNEIITVDFKKVPAHVDQIIFFLNSYKKQDFADIPFATIRLYEGTPDRVNTIHAIYDVANGKEFAGKISMVMGKFYRRNGEWKFSAIGDPTTDRDLKQTITTILTKYA
ncbi:TerD family protein [Halosquirtibacter xylanolyticus]|uniref:TerD family protein n=1 Tax=Halosquirtibacter xylanolyticus TaxID=3374599 RepID=UPI0037484F6D|nr:TerD family protein [Prolixibacteraceae bacterium]